MRRTEFLVAALFSATLVAAQTTPAHANEIYNRVAPATAMFLEILPEGKATVAAGVLVDADKRLVVTAEHVVHRAIRDGSFKTSVMFPVFDKAGKVNTNAAYYLKNRQKLSIPGEVIYFDRTKDLAIVRLERAPDGVKAVPLATGDIEPGDKVHVVGNSTFFDGGAFDYCAGTVRNQFYMNKASVSPAGVRGMRDLIFFTLCNDIPTNHGDSGGPTVNAKGELVAVVSRGTPDGDKTIQVVDTSVHIREIRRALEGIQQPSGSTLEVSASVDRPGFDSFFLPVTKGTNLAATLKGKGTTDMDLYLKDIDVVGDFWQSVGETKKYPDYAKLLQSIGPTDEEQISGSVAWTGIALVQVQNVGGPNAVDSNQYTLSINWSHQARAPFTFIRKIAAKGGDSIKLPYEAGKGKARATVRGDGFGTLDMEVLDAKGASVAKSKALTGIGYHDMRSLTWDPAADGVYTVRINNSGNQTSEYVFTTD